MGKIISLEEINCYLHEDQILLYDIIKFRYKNKDIVNIKHKTNENIPSFEDHCKYLQSGNYKKIYKIKIHDIVVGAIYLHIDDVNSTFLLPNLLRKALKFLKENNIPYNKEEITPQVQLLLFKKHEDVKCHFASVNPKNKLSLNGLIENGYEPIEIKLVMYTKNGKCINGKWKNYDPTQSI
jgi:hypothetical protein